jgi:membrane-associated phospholipid phosphatase
MKEAERQDYSGKEAALAWCADTLPARVGGSATAQQGPRGIFAFAQRELAAAWAECREFEWAALSYLGFSSLLVVLFAGNLAHPGRILEMQLFVASLILLLCRVTPRNTDWGNPQSATPAATDLWPRTLNTNARLAFSQRFCHFWRHWYPHLFFLFCFEEMGKLVHLFNFGWQDAKLIAFDRWLTGVNPSLWLEHFAHPALNEFMQFAYFTYFVYLLILGGILYHRCEWNSYWAVMTYSGIAYALGYFIAIIFPVQSPWFTFAGMWHGNLVGGPFTALINLIEKCGRVHGAAFPSQHVAGAMAALLGAWRYRRWLFWVFLPFFLCMCVSTVYVRNHYVADVFGGLVTGTLGYLLGLWILKKRVAGPDRCNAVIQNCV